MLAVTVIKNTVTKRLWNFQIHFLPYSNAFEEKFFFQTCSFIIFFNFVPEGHISKMLALTVIKNAFSKYDLGDKVEENDKRTCLEKKNFPQTHSNKAGNGFENSKGA